jgi:hypothetical protein
MPTELAITLDPPSTDAELLQSCARLGEALASLAGHVRAWTETLAPLRPAPAALDRLHQAADAIAEAASATARAADAFEDEFGDARHIAARGLAITGHGPHAQSPRPQEGGHPVPAIYTTARQYQCPHGCKGPYGKVTAIVPDGTGLPVTCTECGQRLTPTGRAPLAGSWEIQPCGNTLSCRRDPGKCLSCKGTRQRVVCTTCQASGCDGVHNFCLACDGSRTVDCPRCEGERTVPADGEAEPVPCPDCEGRGRVTCPACRGTGKPPR